MMDLFRCTRCLYPNTKPDLHFSMDGLCSACQAYDRRNDIDWNAKRDEFMQLVRSHPGASHDVIVACSGGKDSTAQVVKCLELGLRPLAVTASTDDLSSYGRRNLDNIKELCDHVEVQVHLPTRRKIAAFALREIGDISWCEHQLIWSVPAREAVQRRIPIVLYGECPQNEYGAGPQGSETQTQLTPDWIHEFGGLLGLRLSDVGEILGIAPRHLELYRHPSLDMERVQAVFMGAYFPWDGYENCQIARDHGFCCYDKQHVEGSLYNYENIDNCQTGLHDFLRFLKFGFTRCDDIASNHIRRGRLTREEGAKLSLSRCGAPNVYLGIPWRDTFAKLGISQDEFQSICSRFIQPKVVEWASSPASFQSFFGTSTAASKVSNSIQAAA